jgi:hypothetical protein
MFFQNRVVLLDIALIYSSRSRLAAIFANVLPLALVLLLLRAVMDLHFLSYAIVGQDH